MSNALRNTRLVSMNERLMAKLRELGANESVEDLSAVHTLYQFTKTYVRHARDLAKSGQRDSARNWHRYFTNSSIVSLISRDGNVSSEDVAGLQSEIKSLGLECHPEHVANWETDIQAIRSSLDEIRSILISDVHRQFTAECERQNHFSFYAQERDN